MKMAEKKNTMVRGIPAIDASLVLRDEEKVLHEHAAMLHFLACHWSARAHSTLNCIHFHPILTFFI